jgi:hypothetical protein
MAAPRKAGGLCFAVIRHDLDEATRESSSMQNVDEIPTDAMVAIDRAGPSPRDAAPHGADPVFCEAAQIAANPVAFSFGCAVNKDGTLVQESADPIVAQA